MQNYPYNAPPSRRTISSVGRASPLQGGVISSNLVSPTNCCDDLVMIGRLAQLVEHLPYKEGVISSNLVSPTIHPKNKALFV